MRQHHTTDIDVAAAAETLVETNVATTTISGTQLNHSWRRKRRSQRNVSNVLVFSLITLMVMFCMGTPLTLMLTIPAYVLANKVLENLILNMQAVDLYTLHGWRCISIFTD